MGPALSCGQSRIDRDFSAALRSGELKVVELILQADPGVLRRTTFFDRLSPYHIAAAYGHEEMLSMLLGRWCIPDALTRHKETPLMLAAMQGKAACVEKLLQAGANILRFDSHNGRTCLHYAAYYGHSDCLQAILQAAYLDPISASWGFARFVNTSDAKGLTALHLSAKQGKLACLRLLLDEGALIGSYTSEDGFFGRTPLHLAAQGGSVDCVRELLARGADRNQMDSVGRTPYMIALKRNHVCAALLNPSAAEPLVWPSPIKFISELKPDAKLLLETALLEANRKREKKIFEGTPYELPSPNRLDDSAEIDKSVGNSIELCCICLERACTIEVRECGHQMCAYCALGICCHNKSAHATVASPVCPFCRSNISQLVAVNTKSKDEDLENSMERGSRTNSGRLCEGSSRFRGHSTAMSSFMKMGSALIAHNSDLLQQ